MLIAYVPASSAPYYSAYYKSQVDGDIDVYAGRPIMGGQGLGGIFNSYDHETNTITRGRFKSQAVGFTPGISVSGATMEQTIYGPKETFFGFAIDLEHGYSFPILDVGVSTSWVYDEYTGELIGIATEILYSI